MRWCSIVGTEVEIELTINILEFVNLAKTRKHTTISSIILLEVQRIEDSMAAPVRGRKMSSLCQWLPWNIVASKRSTIGMTLVCGIFLLRMMSITLPTGPSSMEDQVPLWGGRGGVAQSPAAGDVVRLNGKQRSLHPSGKVGSSGDSTVNTQDDTAKGDAIHTASSVSHTISPGVPVLQSTDMVYSQGWNTSPIVIERYQLLFFTVPKVSCTIFFQLLRRMSGYHDWKRHGDFLHNPNENGLKYLRNYPLDRAQEMMTSSNWTRAIFVREPKSRFLSAFLEKASYNDYAETQCCPQVDNIIDARCKERIKTLSGFVHITKQCPNEHWDAQANRVDEKFWRYISFIGYYEDLAYDTEKLLRRLGMNGDVSNQNAWDRYGKSGWGDNGMSAIYKGSRTDHATNADNLMGMYYTQELETAVETMYQNDYELFKYALSYAL